jgi:hypothetical protein
MLVVMAGDEMRAADADRQAVADRLRAALDEGRLDLHEYDERLQRTYAAKTYGDLDVLLTDLPTTVPLQRAQLVPAAAAGPTAHHVDPPPRSDATTRWLLDVWLSWFMVVGIVVAVWALTGNGGSFWPAWVAVPWGIILLGHTVSGLKKGEPQRWADKQDRKARRRAERKQDNPGPVD